MYCDKDTHTGRDHCAYVLFILHHFLSWLLTLTWRYSLNVNSVNPNAYHYILWSWNWGNHWVWGGSHLYAKYIPAVKQISSDRGIWCRVAAVGEVIITVNHRPKADWKPSLLCSNCFLFLHAGHDVRRRCFTSCKESSLSFPANCVNKAAKGALRKVKWENKHSNIVFLCKCFFFHKLGNSSEMRKAQENKVCEVQTVRCTYRFSVGAVTFE